MNETKSYVDRLQLRALYCKSTACTANAFKQIELCHLSPHRCSITQCETSNSALVFGLTVACRRCTGQTNLCTFPDCCLQFGFVLYWNVSLVAKGLIQWPYIFFLPKFKYFFF